MAILTRKSVLAIKKEVVEGTPIAPTASGDYVALQDDFSLAPAFETLENAELKDSLGSAKAIQGLENPAGSFSHYWRHSGVEGQEPDYGPLLESIFGDVDIALTEYNTVAGSTTSAINVDVGEGAFFQRGQALLVKHAAFPWEITIVESVAGDVITPLFNLKNAPATGTDLGLSVTYLPVNDGHPTLSVWHYLGNGGAIQLVSGARVVSLNTTFDAGQLINSNVSFEGNEYYYDPLEVVAGTNDKLDFTDDGGTFVATITAKMYKDPIELAEEIQKQLNAAGTETFTVSYDSDTGKYTIANTTGAVLSLLWFSGANAADTIGALLGFDTSADDTASLSYTSDDPITLSSPQSPVFDTEDPNVAKANEFWLGDATDAVCSKASSVSWALDVPKSDISDICATSGKSGSRPNSRTSSFTASLLLSEYDAAKFKKFRANDNVKCQYNFGKKVSGDWVPGQCGSVVIPTGTITEFEIVDDEGLAYLNITVQAYVNDAGDGEVYAAFV